MGVFYPRSPSTMSTPCSVAEDPTSAKRRRDQLGDAAVATVGKHATMLLAKRLDARAAVVHRVVAIAGTTRDGDDSQIASPDDDLRVTRPAIVLRTSSPSMVARRDQRAIDDPRVATVPANVGSAERSEPRCHRGDDPVRCRLGDRKAGGDLADREVGSQRGARDQDALRERA